MAEGPAWVPYTSFMRSLYIWNANTEVSSMHPDVIVEERGEQFDVWLEQIKREAREQKDGQLW